MRLNGRAKTTMQWTLAVALLACPSSAWRAWGQGGEVASVTEGTVAEAALRMNAKAAASEPAESSEYTLGPGDEISVDVTGHPELSGKRTVGPDGRITLPIVGSVEAGDKTRGEAAAAIEQALSAFYANTAVTVGIDRYTSNRVLVMGAVEHPGVLQFDSRPTLLEAVTRAGALGGGAITTGENPARRPLIPERCIIFRGSTTVLTVDLKKLLDAGSGMADMRLRRDDIVYVPATSDRYVSVLGQVQHPGALQLESSSTVQKLLAEAGGLTDAAGANAAIQIISPASGTTRVIRMKTLLEPAAMDLALKSGDMIFVPKSGFNKATYVLEKLSPLVSIFTAFAFLEQ